MRSVFFESSLSRVYNCEKCGKTYKRKDSFDKHIKLIHESSRSHPCQSCNKIFQSKSALNVHIKRVHEAPDGIIVRLNCEKCDKTFIEKRSLEDHIKSIHEGIRSDPCQICGKDFNTRKGINIFHENRNFSGIDSKKLKLFRI